MTTVRRIKGKLVVAHLRSTRSRSGQHTVKATSARFVRGELRSLSARMYSPATGRYDGKRLRLTPEEFNREWCGVLWRKKLKPVEEFLNV